MAASRQHLASHGLGTPGGLFVTMGLGHIQAFVPALPKKATALIGADPGQRRVVGADPSAKELAGADPGRRRIVGADPSAKKLIGANPSLRTLRGEAGPC